MNPRVIRLWALAILAAGIAFGASSDRLKAQSPPSATQAAQSATKTVLEKARAQEARGRLDLAVQTWQEVLLTEPRNTEALSNLARAAKTSGDSKLSDSYLRQLRAINPNDPNIAKVEQASPGRNQKPAADQKTAPDQPSQIAQATAQLARAAKLSEAGKYEDAMAIYRKVFGTHPPAGEWALAYYQTESAIDGDRADAVEGLRALVEKHPADPRYQIALGRVLTYNPATRDEGRKYLEKYPKDTQAAQAMRQSLLWDAANPAVALQIQAYLATHQDPQLSAVFKLSQPARADASAPTAPIAAPTAAPVAPPPGEPAVKQSAIADARQPPATAPAASFVLPAAISPPAVKASANPALSGKSAARQAAPNAANEASTARARAAAEVAAYEALNANHIAEAEGRFKAIVADDPSDSKGLAGMGYVRMQQGNFLGAISFLEQAKRGAPDDKGLNAALDTARFWFIMGEGQNALSINDLTTAEKRYRSALDLRPNNSEALEGLGGTLLKAQQPAPAIPLFERALQAQPASVEGWRGLFLAQFQGGNAALAVATVKRTPPAALEQLMKNPLFVQALASAYAAVGRSGEAETALEGALKLPFEPEAKGLRTNIELQLGSILSSANKLDQAVAIFKQVLAEDRANSIAWQGLVRVQHATGHDEEAYGTVQSMPPAIYAALTRDTGFAITVAAIYQSEKKLDDAQALLQEAQAEQTAAGQKPSPAIEMQLASIYTDRGSPQLAYPVYQQVLRDNPDRVDAWAGLLSALHVTGHDQEAVEQVKLVPPGVRAQLEANQGYLQTMAAVYGAIGRSREATQFLGKVEQDYAVQRAAPPASVEIQNAWMLYNGIDDAGLYRELMSLGGRADLTAEQRKTVQTIWTNWAARRANQAAAVGNPKRALAILSAAAKAFPDNPVAIKSLAIGYAEAGQPHLAVLIYKSQNMSSGSAADYEAAVAAALADGDNKDAETWLRYALAAYPADPNLLILAARFEQSRGDTARAIKYYRASLKAMPPASPVSKLTSELGLPPPSSPMSLPSPDRPQDISILLAPGNSDMTPAYIAPAQPYLPGLATPELALPPGGESQLVPPYMTNPDVVGNGSSTGSAARRTDQGANPPRQAEVESTVHSATSNALGQAGSQQQVATASQSAGTGDQIYRPYVAYVPPAPAPPPPSVATTGYRTGNSSAVAVQLGDNTPRPVQAQSEVTDVLPTERYAPSARANAEAASHDEVAAARAARIRRMQEDSAARTGQSHPPPEGTITATTLGAQYSTPTGLNGPQIAQPSSPPGGRFGTVPDTGTQQYPQPRTPPAPAVTYIPAAAQPSAPAPVTVAPAATQPVAPQPEPAAPVATAPATPSAVVQPYVPAVPAYPLAQPPTDAELRARNLPPLGGYFEGQVPLPMTPRQQAESELASLEGSYSGWLGGTGFGRYRSGTSGLDRLYDIEAPVEASAVIARQVRLTAVALPVFLTSGVLASSSFSSSDLPYLGTMPANAANPGGQQSSNGIGGEVQLTAKDIGLAVGYTPYEFLVHNVTGRFSWSTLGGHVSLYGDREPVKDTQLSYAGLYDPGASSQTSHGPIWGGVIATNGGARIDFKNANSDFYLSGDGGILTGRHVLDNTRYGGTMGATFRVGNWPEHGSLIIGGTISGMHYDHNEVGLTYGQGGYFSPGEYFLASVPVRFNGHYKTNFHYVVEGALGVQAFEQDEAPFYPLDPALQTNFVPSNGVTCSAAQTPSYNCGEYPLTETTAFNYVAKAEASYRFAEHWFAGAFLSANNSNNYNNIAAGFFFRFVFRAQHSPEGYPAGLFQVDGLRSLQIP